MIENKRQKAKPRTESEYIKKLHKIVYQKQRELEYINNNIQLEEAKSEYQKTIQKLEEMISNQRKELRERDLQIVQLIDSRDKIFQQAKRVSSFQKRQDSVAKTPQYEVERKAQFQGQHFDPQLLQQLRQNRAQFEQAKEKIARLAMQMEVIKGDLEAEQNKNDELVKQIAEAEQNNQRLTDGLEIANADIQTLKQKEVVLQNEIINLRTENLQLTQLICELEQAKQSLMESVKQIRDQSQLKVQLNRLNQQIMSLQSTVEQQRLVRTFVQSNLEQIRSLHQKEIERLQAYHKSKITQVESSKLQKIQSLEANLSIVTNKLAQSKNNTSLLANELQMQTMRFNILQNKYLILQSEKVNQQLQTQSVKSKPDKQASSMLETNATTFSKANEEKETINLKKQIKDLKTSNHNLNVEIEQIRRESQEKIKRIQHQLNLAKKQQNQARQREKKALQSQMKTMEVQKATFQESLKLRQIIQVKKIENQVNLQKLNTLQRQMEVVKRQFIQFQEKNSQILVDLKNKQDELVKLRNLCHQSKKQAINIMNQKDDILKQLQQLKRDRRKIQSQAEHFKETCKLQIWFTDLTNHIPTLKDQIDKAQSAYEVKCLLIDNLCQWISSCLPCDISIKNANQVLHSIHDRRLRVVQHLGNLLDTLMRLMFRSQIKSHSKIALSHVELPINRTQFGVQMSHILQKVDQNDTIIINTAETVQDKDHNQQIFLDNLEKEAEEHISEERKTLADVSQMKQNFKMIKAVNQQLFTEIQTKQKQLTELASKLKSLQEFSIKQQHLKSNIKSLLKQTRPNDRTVVYLNNICSLLGLSK